MRRQLHRRRARRQIVRWRVCGVLLLLLLMAMLAVGLKGRIPPGAGGAAPLEQPLFTEQVSVYLTDQQRTVSVGLEEYLEGVVAAEMPAEFAEEALKAQAVAARTFILRRVQDRSGGRGDAAHPDADVCDNPAHCKAHRDRSAYSPEFIGRYWNKIHDAVQATRGEILVYQGEPITAVFFAMSGGRTENSKDVWGGDLPYLKSVNSAEDENAPGFETTVTLSIGEFRSKVCERYPQADFNQHALFELEERSEGGSVSWITVGGVRLKGTELRSLFDLRSANFTLQSDGQAITFTVRGYGHGVGMSQWGANFLAQAGKTYDEILKTYYSDVEIQCISRE